MDSALWAESLEAAERAARRALELDRNNASAIVAIGSVHRDRWECKEAEEAYLRALTLDPDNVEAHQQYADLLGYVGRFDEAYAGARRALGLDRSPIRLNLAGFIACYNGRYAEAAELLTEAMRTDEEGRVRQAPHNLRRVYLETGDWAAYRGALLEFFTDREAVTGDERFGTLARALRETWPEGAALSPDIAAFITEQWNHASGATMYLALGDRERALDALENYLLKLSHDYGSRAGLLRPSFDSLRDEPRFQAVLARNGLAGREPVRLDDSDTEN